MIAGDWRAEYIGAILAARFGIESPTRTKFEPSREIGAKASKSKGNRRHALPPNWNEISPSHPLARDKRHETLIEKQIRLESVINRTVQRLHHSRGKLPCDEAVWKIAYSSGFFIRGLHHEKH